MVDYLCIIPHILGKAEALSQLFLNITLLFSTPSLGVLNNYQSFSSTLTALTFPHQRLFLIKSCSVADHFLVTVQAFGVFLRDNLTDGILAILAQISFSD